MGDILKTYGDLSRKESVVLNAVEILTATETQIFNMLGKSNAINTVHSYQVDTLRAATGGTVSEAGDYIDSAGSTPTKLTNLTNIIAVPFSVTRTQQAVQHYQGGNELSRQTSKALKDWANDAEFNLVRSTLTSGASGTAPTMSGIIEATSKSSNHTSHASGTVFSASILNGLMADNYDNGSGDVATDLFMGSKLRQVADGFITKTGIQSNVGLRTIVNTVSTYETAFGTLSLHTHRYIQQPGDTTGRILAIRPDKLKVAMLEAPYIDSDLARSGPYDRKAVVGQHTLEVHNQDSNWYSDGFNID